MTSYLTQRALGTIPVLLLISLVVFLLIHAAPGDPTLMLLGEETSAAEVAKAKARWGLDRPLPIQYLRFITSAVAGDFGKSFKYAEPVSSVIKTPPPAAARTGSPDQKSPASTCWTALCRKIRKRPGMRSRISSCRHSPSV